MLLNDTRQLEATLVEAPEIADAAVVTEGSDRTVVLLVRDGFSFASQLRNLVLAAAPTADLRVAVVPQIPRREDGVVDPAGVDSLLHDWPYFYWYEPPADEVEVAVADTLRDVFDIDPVSMTDNLTGLGADSLLMLELIEVLRDRVGVELSSQELFDAGSAGKIATIVRQSLNARS